MGNIFDFIDEEHLFEIWESIYCEYNLSLVNSTLDLQVLLEELLQGMINNGYTKQDVLDIVEEIMN